MDFGVPAPRTGALTVPDPDMVPAGVYELIVMPPAGVPADSELVLKNAALPADPATVNVLDIDCVVIEAKSPVIMPVVPPLNPTGDTWACMLNGVPVKDPVNVAAVPTNVNPAELNVGALVGLIDPVYVPPRINTSDRRSGSVNALTVGTPATMVNMFTELPSHKCQTPP